MPKTILIADDNESVRTIVKLTLQFKGYNLIEVDDGGAAFEKLDKGEQVDLVISDIAMPGMSGLELLDRLRADPRFAKLPVVMFSAERDATNESLMSRGASAFIRKPCGPSEILDVVQKLVG